MLPRIESVSHLLSVGRSGSSMPPQVEVLGDGTIGSEKALGVPGGLETLPPPFPIRWISRIASTS